MGPGTSDTEFSEEEEKTHLARFLDPVRLQVCSVFESDFFFFSVFSDAMAF